MIKFKSQRAEKRFHFMHPICVMMAGDLAWYAYKRYKINIVITETVTKLEEDEQLDRSSPSHREGRAFDVRTKNLSRDIIKDLQNYLNNKYQDYAYLSFSGFFRVAYFHIGTNEHLHIAINARFAVNITPYLQQ